MRTYATMRKNRPDFFIHSGDTIYADGPIPAEVKLPDGKIWKNLVTEEKSKPAETLAEFRGNYKYNLLDENVLRVQRRGADLRAVGRPRGHQQLVAGRAARPAPSTCARNTSTRTRWRWRRAPRAPSTNTCRCASSHRRARPRLSQDLLRPAARRVHARHAQLSRAERRRTAGRRYGPDAYFLGPTQVAWLKRELMASRATWKVIAADMPLGLVVVYDGDRKFGIEAIAQGDGPPRGRELEIADLLSLHQARRRPQHGVAHRRRALHRGALLRSRTRRSSRISSRSGSSSPARSMPAPSARTSSTTRSARSSCYMKAPTKEQGQNLSPSLGLQFFGHVAIDGATERDDGDAEGRRTTARCGRRSSSRRWDEIGLPLAP